MNIKGFTYGYGGKRGSYQTVAAKQSQQHLIETGVNWVCLAPGFDQETCHSTEIYFDYRTSITDKELSVTIERFHENHVKVCLKPMLNCKDGIWRAYIDFPDQSINGKDLYWEQWFESYTSFILHYAEIAEEEKCEMLCIGCELLATERKEKHWRKLIEEVRKVYSGALVYNTNHGREGSVKWFDVLDYIGTSAYYPVAKYPGDSMENMCNEWKKIGQNLKKVSEKYNKKIIFMEVGCRSARGCAKMPWDYMHKEFPMDEEEQANFYEACLSALFEESWLEGMFWWEWSIELYDSNKIASVDTSFNVHKKQAEKIIKDWYTKEI